MGEPAVTPLRERFPRAASEKSSENNATVMMLLQFGDRPDTRTYKEYDSLADAMMGLCELYEQGVKIRYPDLRKLEYGLADLLDFVRGLTQCQCLTRHGAREY